MIPPGLISPSDPAVEDELATALYRANRQGEAITQWHEALAILSRMQQHAMYPESWFSSFETVTRHLGQNHLTATFRPEIETILDPYLAKNGKYRSNELLRAIYKASATPAEGANFIITVANSASDPNQILDDLNREPWLAEESRVPILLRQIELDRETPPHDPYTHSLSAYQGQLIEIYLSQNQVAKAQALYDSLPGKDRKGNVDTNAIVLAVRSHRLQTLLDAWRANPDSVPKDSFGAAMYRLMKPTFAYKPNLAAIRPLQEFVVEYKRQNDGLVPTDFLALAQLRLDTGDLPGALDLLHQLTLQHVSSYENGAISFPTPDEPEFVPGTPARVNFANDNLRNPYSNTDYAASLLEKDHLPAEAVPFLQSLVRSVPWDATYLLRLAQAQLASNARDQARTNFLIVARNASAPYDLRVRAAHALAPLTSQPTEFASGELTFIAHPSTVAAARQPYASEARIAAASLTSTYVADRKQLLREAIAISPGSAGADSARLDLLSLQPSNADPSSTLAILRSLQNTPVGYQLIGDTESDATLNDPDAPARGSAIDSPGNVAVPATSLPPAAFSLDLAARIHLATQLSLANQSDGDLESAFAYAALATTLAKDPQPELTRRRDDLKTALLLARRNSRRRPDLHAALAQSKQVRPRLTASTIDQEESQ